MPKFFGQFPERIAFSVEKHLEELRALRAAAVEAIATLKAERQAIADGAKAEKRDALSAEETAEFRAKSASIKAELDKVEDLDEQIRELESEIERSGRLDERTQKVAKATASVTSVKEPITYARGNGNSYFRDLMRVKTDRDEDGSARERLMRHAVDAKEQRAVPSAGAMDRTDSTGGYFVPPAWLMDQYIELARSGRTYANLTTQQMLPPGTDSLNIPKVLSGTSTAIQTADNAAIQDSAMTDTTVNVPVRTIAGFQDIAIQSLDQSPLNFDEVIFRDLVADYATKVDLQVISGTGSSGQVTGVRATSGIETITATSGSDNVSLLYAKLADAAQRIHTKRFAPPSVIVMHPRRWAYFLAAVDADKRPLVVPSGPSQNAIATFGGVVAEQVVGQMHGLPVVTDPNLPTTLDTNQDVIHVLRASDLWLYESPLRTRVLDEIGSESLTVRLQVYGYVAFTAARHPKSVVEIKGTALATPGFGD
ncbi:major capsid protein [Mycobacterium phage Hannaconda]|uniref:Major capsid protein n=2 Tax=Omegavirus courthouse TaxID=1089119 RepID=G8I571_9CAUD|nr:major head protein [Mycobacterium phage Courthouse]AER47865.1 major capsid protein [Mycobacterium phage Courthouse]ATS92857.1 major capsid protein [Mycobacterium phage Superphikiman]QGJ93654.1 major capsid protein [Mycobacterium phage Hannaconda]